MGIGLAEAMTRFVKDCVPLPHTFPTQKGIDKNEFHYLTVYHEAILLVMRFFPDKADIFDETQMKVKARLYGLHYEEKDRRKTTDTQTRIEGILMLYTDWERQHYEQEQQDADSA